MQQEDLECTSNAVRVQLDCYANIAPNPRSTLLERNSRAIWQVVMLACPRIIKDAIGTFQMLLECHTNI